MANLKSVRSALTWVGFGLLTGVGVTLAVVLVNGVSVADEPGTSLGIDVVTVGPGVPGNPTATPTPTPTRSGESEIIPEPTPVEVEIDDHGGDRPDNISDDSGSSGSSGSGSSGSGSSGSGK